jgi:RING finger and CHY zinc finger domain-containing protein 1
MHEPANHARDSSGPSNDNNDEPLAPGPGPSSVAETASEDLTALRNRGRGLHGCRHYRRRARFITPCCNEEWWCRHCHNEAKYQQEPEWEKKHELDRKRITELVCALCSARQPVSTYCKECGVAFGAYACTICPFFDDDLSKQTYHCDDCGICRVGGRENYFHCATCGSCYAANLRNNHVCVERAMHQNCPVCFEFLFESVDPTTVLRCGHTIHTECLRVSKFEENVLYILSRTTLKLAISCVCVGVIDFPGFFGFRWLNFVGRVPWPTGSSL